MKIHKLMSCVKGLLMSGVIHSTFLIAAVPFVSPATIEAQTVESGTARLQAAHSRLRLIHGSLAEEYPEQLMAAMFIPADAKVLELGANVGRNSCVIATLLNDSRNLVAVESSEDIANLLQQNRDVNGLQFHIEASAVSKVPLIQNQWNTVPSDVDVAGWTRVKTITFDQVRQKYGVEFDTLVVDCEGALYYILRDDPGMLRNIKLVIIENDFFADRNHMFAVQEHFKQNGMQCVYNQPGGFGPCSDQFYQVWKK